MSWKSCGSQYRSEVPRQRTSRTTCGLLSSASNTAEEKWGEALLWCLDWFDGRWWVTIMTEGRRALYIQPFQDPSITKKTKCFFCVVWLGFIYVHPKYCFVFIEFPKLEQRSRLPSVYILWPLTHRIGPPEEHREIWQEMSLVQAAHTVPRVRKSILVCDTVVHQRVSNNNKSLPPFVASPAPSCVSLWPLPWLPSSLPAWPRPDGQMQKKDKLGIR